MPWCRITITYGATGYTQNYKRLLGVHSHALSQQFTQDALQDALARINANLRVGFVPNPVTQNLLGISNQADQLGADPGGNYRAI
jgi:hypothetical protein